MTDEMERQDAGNGQVGRADEDQGALELGLEEGGDRDEENLVVEELRAELDALNDRHLRLAAEFDNYRKRSERDRAALSARLQVDLVRPLLDVLDDLERVSESDAVTGAGAESMTEGVRLVEKKFRGVLESAGVEVLEAAGRAFDPEVMEALMMVPTTDPEQDGQVADVFQKGYRFRDALIRPARVRVLKFDETAASE
jgi:molecular chaperone GrpE